MRAARFSDETAAKVVVTFGLCNDRHRCSHHQHDQTSKSEQQRRNGLLASWNHQPQRTEACNASGSIAPSTATRTSSMIDFYQHGQTTTRMQHVALRRPPPPPSVRDACYLLACGCECAQFVAHVVRTDLRCLGSDDSNSTLTTCEPPTLCVPAVCVPNVSFLLGRCDHGVVALLWGVQCCEYARTQASAQASWFGGCRGH